MKLYAFKEVSKSMALTLHKVIFGVVWGGGGGPYIKSSLGWCGGGEGGGEILVKL